MANLNSCNFIGYLGQDPDCKQTKDGKDITNISIGVTESWKNKSGEKQSKTEWINCTLFGHKATFIGKYAKKGSQVLVCGKMKTEKYTDKQGIEKYSTKIIVDGFGTDAQILDSKPKDDNSYQPTQEQKDNHNRNFDAAVGVGEELNDSDIPF